MSQGYRGFEGWLKGHESLNNQREDFTQLICQLLTHVGRLDLMDSPILGFSPNCRHLTPGPGYSEAITADNAEYAQTPIRRFTKTDIETQDGVHREVDAIFCATGANIDFIPQFPIIGRVSNWKPLPTPARDGLLT